MGHSRKWKRRHATKTVIIFQNLQIRIQKDLSPWEKETYHDDLPSDTTRGTISSHVIKQKPPESGDWRCLCTFRINNYQNRKLSEEKKKKRNFEDCFLDYLCVWNWWKVSPFMFCSWVLALGLWALCLDIFGCARTPPPNVYLFYILFKKKKQDAL